MFKEQEERILKLESACKMLAEYIDARGSTPGWDSATTVISKILSPENCIVYPPSKCKQCGAEWCDHTSIETLTPKGRGGELNRNI